MISPARIRLEGQLEVLEAAVTSLREGLHAARRGDFRPLKLALDMRLDDCRRHVGRLAGEAPELQRLDREYVALCAEAASRVRERARQLQLPELPVKKAAAALAFEAVQYEGRARQALAWVAPIAIAVFVAFEVVATRSWMPLAIHGVVGLIVAGVVMAAPRLVVTSQRALFGDLAVRLDELKSVRVRKSVWRSRRPYVVTATLWSGEALETRLPWVPGPFLEALHAANVDVRRDPWWM